MSGRCLQAAIGRGVIVLALMLVSAQAAQAQSVVVRLTRTVLGLDADGFIPPGTTSLTFRETLSIVSGDAGELASLGATTIVPEGWELDELTESDNGENADFDDIDNSISVFYIQVPDADEFPLRYAYSVIIPEGATGPVTIEGEAVYLVGLDATTYTSAPEVDVVQALSAERTTASNSYQPTQTFVVDVSIDQVGNAALTDLKYNEQVPNGLTFAGLEPGGTATPSSLPTIGQSGVLSFGFATTPTFPATFSYRLRAAGDAPDTATLAGRIEYEFGGDAYILPLDELNLSAETCISFTRTPRSTQYRAGETVTFDVQILGDCSNDVSSLGLLDMVPTGWTLVDAAGARPPNVADQSPTTGELEFAFFNNTGEFLTFPISFNYTVEVPDDETRPTAEICGRVFFRFDAEELQSAEVCTDLTLLENLPPDLVLLGANPMNTECGVPYEEPGYTVTDDTDPDLSNAVVVTGTVDFNQIGGYQLTYTVEDSRGASDTEERTVFVVDTTPPTLTLLGDALVTVECNTAFNDPGVEALDSCEGDLTASLVTGGDLDLAVPGDYTVTYDVADTSGNEAQQISRAVRVQDITAPSITLQGAPEVVIECRSPYIEPGFQAVDSCEGDISNRVVVDDDINTDAGGTYTVTYDVLDASGNAAVRRTRTVVVRDEEAPTITLLGGASITVDCSRTGAFTDPGFTATDICEGDLTGEVQVAGVVDLDTPGSYTLTYSLVDNAGNSAQARTRTVTVVDDDPPSIAITGGSTVIVACGQPYNDLGATATDTCAGSVGVTTGGLQGVNTDVPGNYTVTYTATDNEDNTAQASRTVQVRDQQGPVVELIGDELLTVECGGEFDDPGATASDACDTNVGDEDIQIESDLATDTPGVYQITYSATDSANNTGSVIRTVEVVDETGPVVTLNGDQTVTIACDEAYVELGATAEDTCSGDLTEDLQISEFDGTGVPGTYEVAYVVFDDFGNLGAASRTVIVTGSNETPIITLNGAADMQISCGGTYSEPGATVVDRCDRPIDERLAIGGDEVNTQVIGTYVVTYDASDEQGVAAPQVTRTVRVVPVNQTPIITLIGAAEITVNCETVYNDLGANVFDRCNRLINDRLLVSGDTVNTDVPGTYVIRFNATDAEGLAAPEVTRTVVVRRNDTPTITLVGEPVITLSCGQPFTDPGATAIDRCFREIDERLVVGGDTVDVNAVGQYIITYNATDAEGVSAPQVTRTVIVSGTDTPIITLNGSAVITVECKDPFTDPGATAVDRCGRAINDIVVGGATVNTNEPGDYVITYDAQDSEGVLAPRVIRTVQVRDTVGPVITYSGNASITVDCDVPLPADVLQATALDRCDGPVSVTVDSSEVNINDDTVDRAPYRIFFRAQDAAGTITTVTREVNVRGNCFNDLCADADENALLDNPFTCLTETRTEQGLVDQPIFGCERRVGFATWFERGEGQVSVTIQDPTNADETITLSVPRNLLQQGEQGVLVLAAACSFDALYAPQSPVELLTDLPPRVLTGAPVIQASVLVSNNGGRSFFELVDVTDNELSSTLVMSNPPAHRGELEFLRHPATLTNDPAKGLTLQPLQGSWSSDGVSLLVDDESGVATDLDTLGTFILAQAAISSGDLAVSPTTLDFGVINVGEALEDAVLLENLGLAPIPGRARIEGDESFSIIGEGGFELAPSSHGVVTLHFEPSSSGQKAATLVITGGADGEIRIVLNGFATPADKTGFFGCGIVGGESGRAADLMVGMLALLAAICAGRGTRKN